jgi:catechol 2,3-dioxygenase-like lactoylglutathione lyase family enzyme
MTLQPPPIPVLRVFDAAIAKAFYLDWLGFKLDLEHQFDPGLPRYGVALKLIAERYLQWPSAESS